MRCASGEICEEWGRETRPWVGERGRMRRVSVQREGSHTGSTAEKDAS